MYYPTHGTSFPLVVPGLFDLPQSSWWMGSTWLQGTTAHMLIICQLWYYHSLSCCGTCEVFTFFTMSQLCRWETRANQCTLYTNSIQPTGAIYNTGIRNNSCPHEPVTRPCGCLLFFREGTCDHPSSLITWAAESWAIGSVHTAKTSAPFCWNATVPPSLATGCPPTRWGCAVCATAASGNSSSSSLSSSPSSPIVCSCDTEEDDLDLYNAKAGTGLTEGTAMTNKSS